MNYWFDFLDLKHDVICFGHGKDDNHFKIILDAPKIVFPIAEMNIIFEYNNLFDIGVNEEDRYGVCLFEYSDFDYVIIVNGGSKFERGCCLAYGFDDAGLLGLEHLWSYIFSGLEDFYNYREKMLFTHRAYKDKKKLDSIIPVIATDVSGVIKV